VQRVGEAVEQVEERLRSPVQVLDDEDEEAAGGERTQVARPAVDQPLAHVGRRDPRRARRQLEADCPRCRLEHGRSLLGRQHVLDRAAELRERDGRRVGVEDRRERLRNLRERHVPDALAVRGAPAAQEPRVGQPLDQLLHEP
jgi:hypothetical protein